MPLPLLPLLTVLLLYLASPGPGFAPLAWVALVPLFFFCRQATCRQAALWGVAAGTLYHLLLIYWVTISMETYGGLPPLVSWPALILLALYMALYFGLFTLLISWSWGKTAFIWLAPALWVALDYCRAVFLTGFPWMDLGYSQYNQPHLIQTADIAGHHAVTFILVLTNALLAQFLIYREWCSRHKTQMAVALLLIAASLTYSTGRLQQIRQEQADRPQLQIAVIQANINQALKWQPDQKKKSLESHLSLSRQALARHDTDLVIWPETALALYPNRDPLMAYVKEQTVRSFAVHLLTGAPHARPRPATKDYAYYNSALLLKPEGPSDIYLKQHLVPFGEYIPLRTILPIPGPIVESLGDFSAGTSARPLAMGRARLGVLICIEAIYPDLARRTVQEGATLLINITNDAWFGRSSAPRQHLAMAIFRTIENRRGMARAANTGISALILPSGEIVASSPLFQPAFLNHRLPLVDDLTFFTRVGYLFPHLCLLFSLWAGLLAWKKGRCPVK